MEKNSTQFQPGNPGRPKGIVNRKIKIANEFAQSFLKDGDFSDSMRLILANPHHELFKWAVELMFAYAYGKPREHRHQTSDGTLPAHHYYMAWVDYDKFFETPTPEREVDHRGGSVDGQVLDWQGLAQPE